MVCNAMVLDLSLVVVSRSNKTYASVRPRYGTPHRLRYELNAECIYLILYQYMLYLCIHHIIDCTPNEWNFLGVVSLNLPRTGSSHICANRNGCDPPQHVFSSGDVMPDTIATTLQLDESHYFLDGNDNINDFLLLCSLFVVVVVTTIVFTLRGCFVMPPF
jgi:hypothetical protein